MAGLPVSAPGDLPLPEWFRPKEIIEQVLQGKRTPDIAADLGVTWERLNYYLLSRAPEDWKEAQVIRAIRRKEEAEGEIEGAFDMLDFQKAQAKLRSAQWELERVCRRIYGEKVEVAVGQIVIQVANLRGEPRLVSGESDGEGA